MSLEHIYDINNVPFYNKITYDNALAPNWLYIGVKTKVLSVTITEEF